MKLSLALMYDGGCVRDFSSRERTGTRFSFEFLFFRIKIISQLESREFKQYLLVINLSQVISFIFSIEENWKIRMYSRLSRGTKDNAFIVTTGKYVDQWIDRGHG